MENQNFLTEFSDDELENIVKVAKEIIKATPIEINIKKGTIKADEPKPL